MATPNFENTNPSILSRLGEHEISTGVNERSMANNEDDSSKKVVKELFQEAENKKFYSDARIYWSTVQPTVEGMLGGFAEISSVDIRESFKFLKDLNKIKPSPGSEYALDCGAGIGRITKYFLTEKFEKVDIVEQDENFARNAVEFVNNKKLINVFNKGLQDFSADQKRYDVIWCQWVLGHLNNMDLLEFLKRSAYGLKEHGVIVMKENVTSTSTGDIDAIDSSVTRPLKVFQKIIKLAGFKIIKLVKQGGLPEGLYPVYIIAIRPTRPKKI